MAIAARKTRIRILPDFLKTPASRNSSIFSTAQKGVGGETLGPVGPWPVAPLGAGAGWQRLVNHNRLLSSPMGTRAGHTEKTAVRALQRRHALLAAWLDLLHQIDNPMRRRAAKFRRDQCPRRDVPVIRGPRIRDFSSGLCSTPQRPRLRG